MMFSGFIQSVISITDAAFLSRYSELAYNASGSAGLWYITLYIIFIGLSDGSQIIMAEKIGRKENFGLASTFHSNIIVLSITAIILFTIVQIVIPQMMNAFVHNKELAVAEVEFLQIRSVSFWACIFTLSSQAVYLSTGKTAIVMYTAILVAVCNIVLDYFMVFGIWIFPEMGMRGAAWASTISEIIGAIFITSALFFGKLNSTYALFASLKATSNQMIQNLKIGIPLLFQGLVALSIWTVFFVWIEQMGENELTVSLNIRYIYFLAFIPVFAFASTTKTFVAQYHGAKMYEKIPIIQRRIQLLSVLLLFIIFHGAFLYPEKLVELVSTNSEHIEQSASILRVISFSFIIYGFGSVYFQSISGLGKTRITLIVECVTTGVYLVSAYLFIKVWKLSIDQVWLVEYVYYSVMLLTTYIYLRYIYKYE